MEYKLLYDYVIAKRDPHHESSDPVHSSPRSTGIDEIALLIVIAHDLR